MWSVNKCKQLEYVWEKISVGVMQKRLVDLLIECYPTLGICHMFNLRTSAISSGNLPLFSQRCHLQSPLVSKISDCFCRRLISVNWSECAYRKAPYTRVMRRTETQRVRTERNKRNEGERLASKLGFESTISPFLRASLRVQAVDNRNKAPFKSTHAASHLKEGIREKLTLRYGHFSLQLKRIIL